MAADEDRTALMDRGLLAEIRAAYGGRWHLEVVLADASGRLLDPGRLLCTRPEREACRAARAFAIAEALRWGEATVIYCPGRRLVWAVPLMQNEEVAGGLLAHATESVVLGEEGPGALDLRAACSDLRLLAERYNLTNASALRLNRKLYHDEQQRAYALHAFKQREHSGIRELYLREEPALFSAIRSGDRGQAREILNRILVAIHQHTGSRLALVKSYFLELVVSMCRSAVEAGGDAEDLLGANLAGLTELARIEGEEDLAAWLRRTLEHLIDAIRENRRRDSGTLLFDALQYMERHCCEGIGRDEVARAAHLSPSHFSTLLRRESGATFTELLNRMRIDRAAERIASGEEPLSLVAQETGFSDQSYFTKVFKRYRGVPPLQFRRRMRRSRAGDGPASE